MSHSSPSAGKNSFFKRFFSRERKPSTSHLVIVNPSPLSHPLAPAATVKQAGILDRTDISNQTDVVNQTDILDSGDSGPWWRKAEADNFHILQTHACDFLAIQTAKSSIDVSESVLDLLNRKRVKGAELDSSDRHPPPRCHPKTRREIKRGLCSWLDDSHRRWHLIWLSGPAGIGKSALIQSFAEYCAGCSRLGASVFFSKVQMRDNLANVVCTIAYQLAIRHAEYKTLVTQIIANDPSLVEKNLRTQFQQLILQPFSRIRSFQPLLICIDGLDECTGGGMQQEFVKLVSEYIRSSRGTHSLLWLISSRSDSRTEIAFARAKLSIDYGHLQLTCDVDDVYHILKDGLQAINDKYGLSNVAWPAESILQELSSQVGGFPIMASCLLRFIGDETHSPDSQLDSCMQYFKATRRSPLPINPFQELDTCYKRIMNDIPPSVTSIVRLILAFCIHFQFPPRGSQSDPLRRVAEFLHLDWESFDVALQHLRAVVDVNPHDSAQPPLKFFHMSFVDFLLNPGRSGHFSLDMEQARVHLDMLSDHSPVNTEDREQNLKGRASDSTLEAQCRTLLVKIAASVGEQRQLVGLRGLDAHAMADFLSKLLRDQRKSLPTHVKRTLLSLLVKLVKSAQVFPNSFELQDVRCDLLHPIYESGLANIYRGEYNQIPVCLKASRISSKTHESVNRVRAQAGEFIVWAHLSHQNILPFLGIFFPTTQVHRVSLVSPWMRDGDLEQYLNAVPKVPRIPLLYDIISGLRYLHELDIVHGDLKAKNIFISETKRAMLADFGSSRVSQLLTTTNNGTGTTHWRAPELFRKSTVPNRASDVWAFGCVCYEVLTGLTPFQDLEDWELGIAFYERTAVLQRPEREALPKETWIELEKIWPIAERCWGYDSQLRPTSDELLNCLAFLNSSDDRLPNPEVLEGKEIDITIDYDCIYRILHQIQESASDSREKI